MTNSTHLQQTITLPAEQELEQTTQQVLQLALKQYQSGQIKAAEDLYRAILEIQPNQADANHYLGMMAVRAGQASAGIPHFEIALESRPEREEYWLSYLDALLQTGQLETAQQLLVLGRQHGLQGEAVEHLAERMQRAPQATTQLITAYQSTDVVSTTDSSSVRKKLAPVQAKVIQSGHLTKKKPILKKRVSAPSKAEINALVALYSQGRITEAEALARSLSLRFPLHGFGWKVLGAVLQAQERFEEALLCMQEAVRLMPEDAEALCNLGVSLQSQDRFVESEINLNHALALKPDYVEALSTLGVSLQRQGRFVESEISLNHALALKPDYAKTHVNLGAALLSQGRLPEATKAYQRALEIGPMDATAHSNLLFCMSHNAGVDPQQLYAAYLAFGEQFEAPLRAGWQVHNNTKDPTRCLQIGFVSGDLFSHAVASFLTPVLVHLVQNATLSLHAYYTGTVQDEVTQEFRGLFAHWHQVATLSETHLANAIRADGIDILFDLSGHTAGNRLLTFARKPAPIQITWIGFPGTTGLQAMDYILCDRFYVPPHLSWQFTEKTFYLPSSAIFIPSLCAPPVNELPAKLNGYITFGSFNRPDKINESVIALWSMLLRKLPTARMLLGAISPESQGPLVQMFAHNGVEKDRLVFRPRSDLASYLALHNQVDICLDTYPYGGGTTTAHAAWMGVPTLTLAGESPSSRVGLIFASHLGLHGFIASSIEDFVEKGCYWAQRFHELSTLRLYLRLNMESSPLRQTETFTNNLEVGLRIMWQRWCAGLQTESFEVNRQEIT